MLKVLVVRPNLAERIVKQKDLLPGNIEIIVPEKGTDEELIRLARDVEIIVCTRLSADVVRRAKRLQLIQKTGAGVDALPFEAINEEIFVANTSGANPVPLAEGTIALMFALAKRVVQRHNLFPERSFQLGTELRGKNLGIVGLGHIGIEIAKRLQAFEMDILALKRQPSDNLRKQLKLKFLGGSEDLNYLLSESDFVVLTLPLTPATRGLIGERELRMMKPTAFLINVSRAAVIEEEPLYKALKDERIAGAALDVWWIPHWWDPKWKPELNKPSRYPFWELPNVIATPHNIVASERTIYSERAIRIMAENIGRIAKGEPPINQVDKGHQY
ncbi:MAG: 2-hydroxyacid dehydrogenase [Promethearchaeota archaeon]